MTSMKKEKVLIVGAGLYGATVAACLTEVGYKNVTVMESRSEVGGNVADHWDKETNCFVSDYGAHIFHTNSDKVWWFVNRYTGFFGYRHYVKATTYDYGVVDLPFGMSLFSSVLGLNTPEQARAYFESAPKGKAKTVEEWCLQNIGPVLYEAMVKGYTEKQWAKPCSELPASLVQRLPLRFTYDNTYFKNAKHQGMPMEGYSNMVNNMLRHCEVLLNTRATLADTRAFDKVFWSGSLDNLFYYQLGALSYRGLRFEHQYYDVEVYQGCPVMNYTSASVPWTRKIEHKQFWPSDMAVSPRTLITTEYPADWKLGDIEYYPVKDTRSEDLLDGYEELLNARAQNITVGGRLGTHQYYDMDQVVGQALIAASNYINRDQPKK